MGTYFYVPLKEVVIPRSGECLEGYFWTYHDDRGVLFWTWRHRPPPFTLSMDDLKPQANRDKSVCDFIIKRLHEGHRSLLVPVAYLSRAVPHATRALKENAQ